MLYNIICISVVVIYTRNGYLFYQISTCVGLISTYLHRFDSVFLMEYPDGLNPKNMITGFISYVDELLIHCLQVSIRNFI